MRARNTILLLGILYSIASFGQIDPNKQIDEGYVKNEVYSSKEIGWTITIPDDWKVISRGTNEKHREKGQEALENTIYEDVDMSELRNLIGFQKDQLNMFKSTSEPFDSSDKEVWRESNEHLKGEIYKAFKNQGIEVDSTTTTIKKIDGQEFNEYEFTLYSPKGDIILKQLVYATLINGFDFGVTLIYNNEVDKKQMLDALLNSKFAK